MMKTALIGAAALLVAAGAAEAAVPAFKATCPPKIKVEAKAGGPVLVNGKEAKLTTVSDTAYKAEYKKIVLDLAVGDGGKLTLTMTRNAKAPASCTIGK